MTFHLAVYLRAGSSRGYSRWFRQGRPCQGTSAYPVPELLVNSAQEIIKTAFENGINLIDTAETYAKGESETHM